jgi:hypothetical protein
MDFAVYKSYSKSLKILAFTSIQILKNLLT